MKWSELNNEFEIEWKAMTDSMPQKLKDNAGSYKEYFRRMYKVARNK